MELAYPLVKRIGMTAFAFRGYNVTNLGRTAELLRHVSFGPMVGACLTEASHLCSDVLRRRVDLCERVRREQETVNLDTYTEDVALVVAVAIAQLRILEKFFSTPISAARLAFGYSLGEMAALIACGVYRMADLLRVPLTLCDDCVALAHDVSMGVLFSRGPALDHAAVKRLCLHVSQEGQGVIDMSAQLSPNSVLLLGQQDTVERYQRAMRDVLPGAQHAQENAAFAADAHVDHPAALGGRAGGGAAGKGPGRVRRPVAAAAQRRHRQGQL